MLTIPPHIEATGFAGAELDFPQTHDALKAAALRDAPKIGGWIDASTNQVGLAFAAAMVEWIAWRLDGPWDAAFLLPFAESLWAAQVHPAYAKSIQPPKPGDDLAKNYVWDTWSLANGVRLKFRTSDVFRKCINLSHIGLLVVPNKKPLNAWVKAVLTRLHEAHPVTDEQSEDRKACNGPAIPREAMDTTTPYDPAEAPAQVAAFLAGLDPAKNPFLASPQEMKDAGFEGEPYTL